jgi:hypothetical protein
MALLLQHRVPCDNFEQYARSRVRVAGGWLQGGELMTAVTGLVAALAMWVAGMRLP